MHILMHVLSVVFLTEICDKILSRDMKFVIGYHFEEGNNYSSNVFLPFFHPFYSNTQYLSPITF